MPTLTFTDLEIVTIIAALHACAPSGGGSTNFHLANRIARDTGLTACPEQIGHATNVAICELLQYYENETPEQLGTALRIYESTGHAPAAAS